MTSGSATMVRPEPVWLDAANCDIDDFAALVERTTATADYPLAAEVADNVPVYDGDTVRTAAAGPDKRRALTAEWVRALSEGPGVIAIRSALADRAIVDAASAHFTAIIAEEKAAGAAGGDHFARPGANDRVWNALQKLCARDPEVFAAYYGNAAVALASAAWLGPGYQMTSQVNVVNPGGAAQSAHRDYHLGFQAGEAILAYPAHVHRLSPAMTLQGAVAHSDMPLETGPTLYLPYSQLYLPGYVATALPAFKRYFAERRVQLPLEKGDAVFFNPALFHGAGDNRTRDIRRMANLLQVSSPFGRAMESVDRAVMSATLYPALRRMLKEGRIAAAAAANAIAAAAEGYSFPTNLDRDPPLNGLAPQTQGALFHRALQEDWEPAVFAAALDAQAHRKEA
jgi:ectoine hydroxylase-related dioxygenase (phytanoyl-CoA dioxygenase family)